MQLQDIKVGLKVQFHTLRGGKRVGLDNEIYTIKDINFNDWGACDILLECDGYEVYTNHEAIEVASDAAIKAWLADKKQDTKRIQEEHYKQLTIFDILEEVAVC